METNADFGNVQLSKNTNVKQSGSGNSGTIKDNLNLQLFVTNSVLNIFHSTNAKISGKGLSINCRFSTNSGITGNNNSVDLEKTTNAKLEGNGNNLIASSSLNLKLFANNTKILAQNVTNGKLKTNEMDVKLMNSTNVNVEGDGGEVSVKNALNQTVMQSKSSSGVENKIEFLPPACEENGESFLLWTFNTMFQSRQSKQKNLLVITTFDKTADIDHHQYILDGVRFSIQPKAHDAYDVLLSEQALDVGSVRTTVTSPTELHVSATKDGTKHVLKFKAPHILQSASDKCKFTFCLSTPRISNM